MPQCASCSHISPEGAKFCPECGAAFPRRCPSCGQVVLATSKFCAECGTALAGGVVAAAPVPVGGPTVSERRTTTVLFGDLVAFATLSEARDPEEVRELLSDYFAVSRTVVHRYGGTVEKFIGDAVMAVWGVPVSHEDDAERAVRAARDLVAEVAALGERIGVPGLALRVGITTGSVAVTLGALHEGMVAGDAVNTAARVQTAAAAGEVWVDAETRGLTTAAIAYSDVGELALKGKAVPVRLFRADAIVAAVGGAQRVDGLEAPMAGREGELRRLKELFHATQADARSRLVVVTGMAGIGKSRLGWEWEKYVDGLTDAVWWHRGRCLSYGDGVAFWAFAEMVRSRLGILEGDDPETSSERLAAGLDRLCADAAERAWLRPRLEALLGTGAGAVFERTDLFAAWATFLDRVGRNGEPVMLLFEDLQHADAGLLDLVEHLLETCRSTLFVIALTRPELLDERPSLAAGRRCEVIALHPLEDDAMAALVDGLVVDLPVRARQAVVARAEGVPLYAVETVRALVDRAAVEERDGLHVFVDHDHTRVDLDALVAPTSLQTLIAARLDALTAAERRVVQDASILGMSFTHAGLMALDDVSGFHLDQALAGLARKGLIEAQTDPRSPERGQYRFLQALVREVAYSTLARRDRKARHLAAAGHLEVQGEDVALSLAGVVARHLLDALAASGEQDPDRAAIAARARARLTVSAERAEALGSPGEALRSTLTALELATDPAEVAALQERGARVAHQAGEPRRAETLAAAARAAYEAAGDRLAAARAVVVQARVAITLGSWKQAPAFSRLGLELIGPDGPAGTRQDLLAVLLAPRTEELSVQVEVTLEMLRLAEEHQEPDHLIRALNRLAIVLGDVGSPTAYVAVLEACVAMAREHRLVLQLGRSLSNLSSEVYLGQLERAHELVEEAVAACRRTGDSHLLEAALVNGTYIWWLGGDWDQLLGQLGDWFEGREVTGSEGQLRLGQVQVLLARGVEPPPLSLIGSEDPWEQVGTEITESLLLAARGRREEAAARARAAMVAYFEDLEVPEDFEITWAPAVELQLRAGDPDAAAELLALTDALPLPRRLPLTRAEIARLRGLIAATRGEDPEPDLRAAEEGHAAYGAPYLLARTRHELGRWLLTHERGEEAAELLDQAKAAYALLGAEAALDELADLTGGLRPPAGGGRA